MSNAVNARQQINYSSSKGKDAMHNLEEAMKLTGEADMTFMLSRARKFLHEYLDILKTCDYSLGTYIIGLDADGKPKSWTDEKPTNEQ